MQCMMWPPLGGGWLGSGGGRPSCARGAASRALLPWCVTSFGLSLLPLSLLGCPLLTKLTSCLLYAKAPAPAPATSQRAARAFTRTHRRVHPNRARD
jgi:hypothetical protein